MLLIAAPALLFFSTTGPGASAAPIWISLAAGLIVGVLAQKSRLCTVGGIRDMILFRDSYLMLGLLSILVASLLANLLFGYFTPGFEGQPIAHSDGLWNFLGMALVGWASVLLGGCPMRQLILAGEGNTDSVVSVMGLLVARASATTSDWHPAQRAQLSTGKLPSEFAFWFLSSSLWQIQSSYQKNTVLTGGKHENNRYLRHELPSAGAHDEKSS
jgi:YedE family putative selenium metabolism protein